ncbi:hypothetical protein IWQ60_000568 [Tieghemiomyces parasiticus]|uniref:Glutamyl-tRNA(Gln) amidotransferase subunit B, mitochondrial n=1 Tax=Tieghemiomyces parasiticus TaxID=78921 RepID=A0A9W8E2R0_9FUNG|nr:hypothetical protein IWQ60_000568 [Tieghemiomyces parasiticus]
MYPRFHPVTPNLTQVVQGRHRLWAPVIGLELHCQLKTQHKLFSPESQAVQSTTTPSASDLSGQPLTSPNRHVSLRDAAFPGTIPRLNPECLQRAVQVIHALGGQVQLTSRFDRKHYFYPDLPQGYQITQRSHPIGRGGSVAWSRWDVMAHGGAGTGGETAEWERGGRDGADGQDPAPTREAQTTAAVESIARSAVSNGPQAAALDLLNPIHHVRIEQIQLEQDTAKSLHGLGDMMGGLSEGGEGSSPSPSAKGTTTTTLVDLNRAGVALVEIVMAPDIRSAREAVVVIRKLQSILRAAGVSDVRMDEGSLRCDVNVSVRPIPEVSLTDETSPDWTFSPTSTVGGSPRVELKNLNSLKLIYLAIQAEVRRHVTALEQQQQPGDRDVTTSSSTNNHDTAISPTLTQETRGFDPTTGETFRLRSKEDAPDYRYMPETDVPAVRLTPNYVAHIVGRHCVPELPDDRRRRLVTTYGLGLPECHALMVEPGAVEFWEDVVARVARPVPAAKILPWLTSELYGQLKARQRDLASIVAPDEADAPDAPRLTAAQLASIVRTVDEGGISGKVGKTVLARMLDGDRRDALAIADAEGWRQVNDNDLVLRVCREIVQRHPDEVAKFHAGKVRLLGWLVGQVVKETKGKANPSAVKAVMTQVLKSTN